MRIWCSVNEASPHPVLLADVYFLEIGSVASNLHGRVETKLARIFLIGLYNPSRFDMGRSPRFVAQLPSDHFLRRNVNEDDNQVDPLTTHHCGRLKLGAKALPNI
ncbi:hypothetical protein E1B28_012304 [Marasmius oreades]|uniref:Uncharacterized protein n=1 Tax=Marasmius oreades TaxID=181124 RepID=A0A9P7UNJ7_9AGAR|nr:uncharacterized protein E1B28_012304 [Marasmius oreades]KAG7088293.1 hypothetical protein E1B28_012304 [Marasmius oreades]